MNKPFKQDWRYAQANREALQAFLLESYTVRGVDDADDWDW